MDLGLSGRRVFVTASTEGLGLACAVALSAEGARVAVAGRRPERVAEVAAGLPGGMGVTGDLTREPERLVDAAVSELGGLDVLVVNTGGAAHGGLLEQTPEDWDAGYAGVLRPALAIARSAVPHLRQSPAGRLVFVTARSILETAPDLALSGVFRSGVAAAARVLALQLAPEVLVNVVVPGPFDTGGLARREEFVAATEGVEVSAVRARHAAEVPLGRVGRAEEFGDVVAFLCSARSSFVTGSVVRVDGGAVRGY